MMEGDVTTIDLLARLVELGRERFTGAIRFENEGIIKILYLKGGDILSASTNDRADSVDELLLRGGKVTREHVKQALAKRKESETLGDALLNLGFITRKELTWGRRVQVISVIRSVRTWTAGTYTIVADYLPKREEGTLFPLQQIIVELIVTQQDRSEFERALDGGSAVFKKASDFQEHYSNLGLNEDADAVAAEIDGERSASEVASFAGRDTFNVFKLLHAFAILGLIERAGKPQPALQYAAPAGADDLLSAAGVADAADVWKPTAPGTVATPPSVPPVPAASSGIEEFGDAPTLEIPVMTPLPPDKPKPAAAPPPPPPPPIPQRRPTQTRAARPVLSSPAQKKKKGSRAPLMLVLLLVLLGGGGYAGWQWWQKRQTSGAPSPSPVQSKPAAKVEPPTTTVPIIPAPSVAPSTTASRAGQVVAASQKPKQPATSPKPTPPAPRPVTTDRYAEMGREYERNANGTFAVQFELVCQSSSLAKAIEAGGSKVWFVPTTYRGQSCYRVFWGRYPTREAAALAVPTIPAGLRGAAPAVVRVP